MYKLFFLIFLSLIISIFFTPMGRPLYYDTVEDCRQISLPWLRKRGCVRNWYSGTITWTSGFSESSIGFEINLWSDDPFMRLHYTSTDRWSGEKTPHDYRIRLIKTPCHFGGSRLWFQCPNCWRKVSTLMMSSQNKYFCRTCLRLTYTSRQRSYHGRFAPLFRALDLQDKYDKLQGSMKRMHYQGRPTKKFRKVLRYKAYLDSIAPLLQHELNQI